MSMENREQPGAADQRDTRMAAETIRGQLVGRDVQLAGDESPEQLANLVTAVERFERAVAARGGDSMTNAPDSADPDDETLVLPRRRGDERIGDYIARVAQATARITRGA